MTVQFPFLSSGSILQGREADILSRIAEPACGASIWQRRPLPEFQNWLDGLPATSLPDLRVILGAGAVESCVRAECDRVGMPASPMRDLLARDIAALGFIFAGIMASPMLRLRLQPVTTDACRRFHIDRVRARMLCTYRGTGTQLQLGPDAGPILELAARDVAILRGTLWPALSGVLHRSPPIAGSGKTRLLLVIDPVTDENDKEDLH
ncbi:DUF1826 domain-containing protein [Paracoccus sp. MBLB3053]|uniref:DUF1826 domain-containing protein n=1 Tax=Paracoccus aurantius TaxID=3073814 RepID=A0ABU2HTW9_9RHOB|nr:DUF1826 domain-containing protein [Paracoccus sp. MBLB3053]MDS9468491.1 DUF1826 domain-containing protein [Paracoccus sp. MBLB3053]